MSATACIQEGHTHDDAEIREWMSGISVAAALIWTSWMRLSRLRPRGRHEELHTNSADRRWSRNDSGGSTGHELHRRWDHGYPNSRLAFLPTPRWLFI